MMLTDLAAVLRAGGLKVEEIPGWKTRGHGEMTAVKAIIAHHTAGAPTGNYPSLGVVRDGRKGLAGPLAQLGLARDGKWIVIAAGLCWHAGVTFETWQNNWHAIGIEAEATGVDAWPTVQYQSYVRGVAVLARRYDVPNSRILGHKEIAKPKGRKSDPNFDMTVFRAAVARTAPLEDVLTAAELQDLKNYIKTENDRVIAANEASNKVWALYVNRYGLQTEDERQRGVDRFEATIAAGGTIAAASAAMWQELSGLDAALAQAQAEAR